MGIEQILIDLLIAIGPLIKDAIDAKQKGDAERHALIVQQFNDRVAAALASANGVDDFADSDDAFHEKLAALGDKLAAKVAPVFDTSDVKP